uniref:EGF-like domain-containing protein n=1 Tax=Romanomermis culicivorax TaxID=13658 RepID=A0A915KY75_ROMCU
MVSEYLLPFLCNWNSNNHSISESPDFCENSFCYNEGTCISNEKLGKAECICAPGWTGTRCSVKNHCDKHKCENGAECINGLNGFTCKCRGEFSGKFCSVPCPSSVCKNGGTCQYDDAASRPKCACIAGFTGEKCETLCIGQDAAALKMIRSSCSLEGLDLYDTEVGSAESFDLILDQCPSLRYLSVNFRSGEQVRKLPLKAPNPQYLRLSYETINYSFGSIIDDVKADV